MEKSGKYKKRADPIDRSGGNFSGEQRPCARCRRPFKRYPASITQNLHIGAGQLDLLAKYPPAERAGRNHARKSTQFI